MMMSSAMSTACQNHIRIIHVRVQCNIACLQTYCTSTYFLMKWIVLLLVLGYFVLSGFGPTILQMNHALARRRSLTSAEASGAAAADEGSPSNLTGGFRCVGGGQSNDGSGGSTIKRTG